MTFLATYHPAPMNVSTVFSLSFFLSDIPASFFSTLTYRVHTMTSVVVAFTLTPFLSNVPCHSTTLLCNSSSAADNTPKSSAYSSYHSSAFLTLLALPQTVKGSVLTSGINPLRLGTLLTHLILFSSQSSTGIIRFFTKQIATEGFSTVFGQSRCAL